MNRRGTATRRAVLASVLMLLAAGTAAADSWPGSRVLTSFSDGGQFFVRITPGGSIGDTYGFAGAAKGPYAQATLYELKADRSYAPRYDVRLLNPVAPVDVMLSDNGYLVTFDNWHNLGYGKVVVIYDPAGKVVRSWELGDLYSPDQLARITQSVSSRYWRCRPWHFTDPRAQTEVYVREALGGSFVFRLNDGRMRYATGTITDCPRTDGPMSWTIHGLR